MRYIPLRIRLIVVGATALVATACRDAVGPAGPDPLLIGGSAGPTLLECPTTTTQSSSLLFTSLGGTVTVAGSAIVVPLNGLTDAATVTLTVPASRFMEINARVNGEEHFQFALPVTVIIDYSRCTRRNLWKPLTVWLIDSQTKALLEQMPAIDNPITRQITFLTDHFSSYSVAQ